MADDIYQRNSIQELSLIKLTIARSPIAIRSLLIKYLQNDGEWYAFIREAKENAWIAFSSSEPSPNEDILRSENVLAVSKNFKNYGNRKSNNYYTSNKFCKFHNKKGHSTEECKVLKDLKRKNIKIEFGKDVHMLSETVENEGKNET